MLTQDITKQRKERHHITQEDFTPDSIIELMVKDLPTELYTDFSKTMLDPCSGTGNILLYVFKKRIQYCKNDKDVYKALSTIYGTELMQDNVDACYMRFLNYINDIPDIVCDNNKLIKILQKNIVCTDSFEWDYENWCKLKKDVVLPLF